MSEFKYGDVLEPAGPFRSADPPYIMFIAPGKPDHRNMVAMRLTEFVFSDARLGPPEKIGFISAYFGRDSWKLTDE